MHLHCKEKGMRSPAPPFLSEEPAPHGWYVADSQETWADQGCKSSICIPGLGRGSKKMPQYPHV